MRIVVALGGNALLRRGEPLTADNQRKNVRIAAESLAPIARKHQLVITHGNGPQVGLLALQSAAYSAVEGYPLDVLGAESQGMIGYMIEQELDRILDSQPPTVTLLTQVEVDPGDPAFRDPSKFVGPVYAREEAERLAQERGWVVKQDGDAWRRVVPSPVPRRILDSKVVDLLLNNGIVVVCAGGGGVPIVRRQDELLGVEAVIDKDRASALLAKELHADVFAMVTDVDAIYVDYGKPSQRALGTTSPAELAGYAFPAGSMGPKVESACDFAQATGNSAVIGSLANVAGLVNGTAGTRVTVRQDAFAVP
ncbi:MAG TPA: carbamate kinase [Ktedonobacterales bacterium]|nr:carbamate kinase [Ktedonobacterales bacterium]